jgi:tetratricopeptide (TPR) repeat protein
VAESYLDRAESWIKDRLANTPRASVATLPLVWFDWAEMQLLLRQARSLVQGAPAADPPSVVTARGWAHAALEQWDRAEADFAQAVAQHPRAPQPLLERARFFAERKRFEPAAADFARASDLGPKSSAIWLERGRFYAALERWKEAIDSLSRAIEIEAKAPALRLERGRLYSRTGQWDQVAADFLAALEMEGPSDLFHNTPANRLCAELARWDAAIARAIDLRPQEARLWVARARHRARLGQMEAAAADYARGARQPDECAWLEHAAVLLLTDNNDGYRRLCSQLMKQSGDLESRLARHVLARTCVLAPGAVDDPQQLVRWAGEPWLPPHAGGIAQHVLGAAHFRAGQFARADQLLKESLALNPRWPGNAMTEIFRAMTLHHLGDARGAADRLAETDRWLGEAQNKIAREPFGFPGDVYPADWLIVQVLRREAVAVLKKPPAGKEPERGMP